MQVDNSLGDCTTITITYSAESDLESLSDEIDSLSAQATSDNDSLAQLAELETEDASSGCEMTIDTSFSLTSTAYINLESLDELGPDINVGTIHPSPPPPPPLPPPSTPPPSVPPVTVEAVNEMLSGLLSGEGPIALTLTLALALTLTLKP